MSAVGESPNGQATAPGDRPLRLVFDAGTLVVEGLREDDEPGLPGVKFDFRTRQFRAEAIWYRTIVEHLRQAEAAVPRTPRGRTSRPRGGSRSPRRRSRTRSRA